MSKRSSQSSRNGGISVALLVSDGSNPFEMGVAMEVFGMPRPEIDVELYRFSICSSQPTVKMRDGLYSMNCTGSLADAARAHTLIVPNRPDPLSGQNQEILKTVRTAYARGARIISFCTGSFTLADAGILRGHTVTTHWRWTEAFRENYADVILEPDVLFIDDGQVLTAAGSAAALDLCLYVVEKDFGSTIAQKVSRRLVFALHREGGQRQFVPDQELLNRSVSFAHTMEWAIDRLDEPITIAQLAGVASMSSSTFHRRFLAEAQRTPLVWLHQQRVNKARILLESTDLTIEQVATRVGMGTATNLRTHFRKATALSPTAYRERFRNGQFAR
jgi:AraC family transcriptional regulator, transcriptional activator FtrA